MELMMSEDSLKQDCQQACVNKFALCDVSNVF